MRLQRDYWRFDPAEKEALLARFPAGLSWGESLRLHHLCCLDLLATDVGRAQFERDEAGKILLPETPQLQQCRDSAQRLLSGESPYRPRGAAVWQGDVPPLGEDGERREPDQFGLLTNASLTHLGCVEVVRLDDQGEPKSLEFLPLSEIIALVFDEEPALFRMGTVFFEDGHEEAVAVPLLYGISWSSRSEYDTNGSMTRFICNTVVAGQGYGIGVGHQDLTMADADDRRFLFGIGSVTALNSASEDE